MDWHPIETAPSGEKIIRLKCTGGDGLATEDVAEGDSWITIGMMNADEDGWIVVGWSWYHDEFCTLTDGVTPVAWAPLDT